MAALVDILDRKDRACLGTDPEVFFPRAGDASADVYAICERCPIRQMCLEYAVERPLVVGIWGGTNHDDRNAMRKQAAREAA